MLDAIINFRKELHQYPELSGNETETVERIKEFIQHHHPGKITELESGGLMVVYDFGEGPVVMLRCELDALPIEEENDFAHRSKVSGVSHKCGHDGHMAVVAGVGLHLKEKIYKRGKVILLFQPAEETGKGAYAVLNDPGFAKVEPDYIFALHNLPGEPLNSVIMVDNYFSATVQSFKLELTGKQAHASEPENGINPAYAISELISQFRSLQVMSPEKSDFALLTPVHENLGSADYGISAGTGELHYTIRTWDEMEMEKLQENIIKEIEIVCDKERLSYSINWFDYFPASKNEEQCNNYINRVASMLELNLINRTLSFEIRRRFWMVFPKI
jgi:amidohydrolase